MPLIGNNECTLLFKPAFSVVYCHAHAQAKRMHERSLRRHSVASPENKSPKLPKKSPKLPKNRHIGNFLVISSRTSNTVSPKWALAHPFCLGMDITPETRYEEAFCCRENTLNQLLTTTDQNLPLRGILITEWILSAGILYLVFTQLKLEEKRITETKPNRWKL